MALAQWMFVARTPPRLLTPEGWRADSLAGGWLAFFGRWSLAFYLLHQPVLIALVFLGSLVVPPPAPDFVQGCNQGCAVLFDAAQCVDYCACAELELTAAGQLQSLLDDPARAQTDLETAAIIAQCAWDAGITPRE